MIKICQLMIFNTFLSVLITDFNKFIHSDGPYCSKENL